MKRIRISVLVLLFSCSSSATDRIKAFNFDRGEATGILMRPGLATALMFPCPIEEAIAGSDSDVSIHISDSNIRQITVSLSSTVSKATNLLVRCKNHEDLFVFDLIPRKNQHQDFIKISGIIGGPGFRSKQIRIIETSEEKAVQKKEIMIRKRPRLIEEGR